MKIRITSNRINVYMVLLVMLLNCASSESLKGDTTSGFQIVDPNRIPEVLTMISNQVRSNYKQIKTWRGEADVTLESICEGDEAKRVFNTYTDSIGTTPKRLKQQQEKIIKFAIDMEKDLLYVNSYRDKPSEYTDFETGKDLGTKSRPWYETSIVTPEYYLHCSPYVIHKGVVIHHMAVKEAAKKCSTCERPPIFDPREEFIGVWPIWETFPQVLQHIDKHGEWNVDGYTLRVEERMYGNTTRYRIQQPGIISSGNYLFITRIFSSDVGFNMISVENTDQNGRLLIRVTWDYDLVNGIYLPAKIVEQHFAEDGNITHEKISIFKKSVINNPISPEVFTYKNLSLKNGDNFTDKILNKEYTYQDANLIEVEKKSK